MEILVLLEFRREYMYTILNGLFRDRIVKFSLRVRYKTFSSHLYTYLLEEYNYQSTEHSTRSYYLHASI